MYVSGILFGVGVGVLGAMVGGVYGVGVTVLGIVGTGLLLYLELQNTRK